jgi:pyruvate ferredoxin oxidoreductase delta subunit
MAVYAVEIINRGVFQYNIGRRIARTIVLAAIKKGKVGTAFGRYSDSPERYGIPMKFFAVVADTDEELEGQLAIYYPKVVDAAVVLDDTLLKGVESWSFDGLHPVNELLKDNGVLLVVTNRTHDELLKEVHTRDLPYKLVTVPGVASFSGMWVIRDDHSQSRILGALANALPEMISPDAVQAVLKSDDDKDAAKTAAKETATRVVEPGEGNPTEPYRYELPVWQDVTEYGITVRGMAPGTGYHGGKEGFETGRRDLDGMVKYRKHLTRTFRPVTNYDACTKTRDCWLTCPEEAYNETPDGYFESNYEACSGCGKCAFICPDEVIQMLPEWYFEDDTSSYDRWKKDPDGYTKWWNDMRPKGWLGHELKYTHGYVRKGQYQEEIKAMGKTSHPEHEHRAIFPDNL